MIFEAESHREAIAMRAAGRTLWKLQALETAAVDYVVVRLRDSRGVGQKRGTEISAEVEALPLGRLISEMKHADPESRALAAPLRMILGHRNWLVHRSFRETHGFPSSDDHFAHLMTRLQTITDNAQELQIVLGGAIEQHAIQSGVSRDYIDREADRLARSWGLIE